MHVARAPRGLEILDDLVGLGIDHDEVIGLLVADENKARCPSPIRSRSNLRAAQRRAPGSTGSQGDRNDGATDAGRCRSLSMGTVGSLCLRSRLNPAYDLFKQPGKAQTGAGARTARRAWEDERLMDARSGAAFAGPALLLDNVVKTYGPVRAVDGVSFKAWPGEFIALLGPNGAGKSTLFQLLSGLFVPDSGRIEVMGHDMTRNAVPALARLGIVFQQPTLDLELSVLANLLFHAGLHGIPRAVARPAHRRRTQASRSRRPRARQSREAQRRQPPAGRTRPRAASRAERAPDGRGDRRPRSGEPQRSPQAAAHDAHRARGRGAVGDAPVRRGRRTPTG